MIGCFGDRSRRNVEDGEAIAPKNLFTCLADFLHQAGEGPTGQDSQQEGAGGETQEESLCNFWLSHH